MKSISAIVCFFCVASLTQILSGCGSVPESTSDTWESTPPVSVNARLEYKVDSLMNETRRLQQQNDALASENRNLASRASEFETRINEMAAKPQPPTPAPTTSTNVAAGYEGALDAFRNRSFTDAILGFEAVLKENAREDLADNCHYWIGECYYGMRQNKDAIEHFRMVLNYTTSEKKDDAQLMIGNASWAMGDKEGAKEAYNTLINSYPTSSLIPKAKERLARLK